MIREFERGIGLGNISEYRWRMSIHFDDMGLLYRRISSRPSSLDKTPWCRTESWNMFLKKWTLPRLVLTPAMRKRTGHPFKVIQPLPQQHKKMEWRENLSELKSRAIENVLFSLNHTKSMWSYLYRSWDMSVWKIPLPIATLVRWMLHSQATLTMGNLAPLLSESGWVNWMQFSLLLGKNYFYRHEASKVRFKIVTGLISSVIWSGRISGYGQMSIENPIEDMLISSFLKESNLLSRMSVVKL